MVLAGEADRYVAGDPYPCGPTDQLRRRWKARRTAIAANPFVSSPFRALVPEMERKFSGGSNVLQKPKPPTCRDIKRWS